MNPVMDGTAPLSYELYYPYDFQVQLLNDTGRMPTISKEGSAGYDLYASQSITVEANSTQLVSTAVCVTPPEGYYPQLLTRSSMAKAGVTVEGGVIDPVYTGELIVVLHNNKNTPYEVALGDRIAQIVLLKYITPTPKLVQSLKPTARGAGAFGSTGK